MLKRFLLTVLKIIHVESKIEKVPRGIQYKKSRYGKFGKTSLNNWSISNSPKGETEPGVRKGKRSLLANHTRCKCSMETTRNSMKVNSGIKVMKIGWKV